MTVTATAAINVLMHVAINLFGRTNKKQKIDTQL